MDWKHRRLLELAGIKRRRTPDRLLLEEEGEDADPFEVEGDEDPFGDPEAPPADGAAPAEDNREPPEELSAKDIEDYGSPRFLDVEQKLSGMLNNSMTSASVGAQHLETYPGEALDPEPTPAKNEEEAGDDEEADEEDTEEANESFYRYGNRRDKWLIKEASRLLLEAEEEGSAADEFDMERFATEVANYMDTITNTTDIEAGVFNAARQMILNNFGEETEQEFIDMLGAVTKGKWDFLPTSMSDPTPEIPIALGAGAEGGGGV